LELTHWEVTVHPVPETENTAELPVVVVGDGSVVVGLGSPVVVVGSGTAVGGEPPLSGGPPPPLPLKQSFQPDLVTLPSVSHSMVLPLFKVDGTLVLLLVSTPLISNLSQPASSENVGLVETLTALVMVIKHSWLLPYAEGKFIELTQFPDTVQSLPARILKNSVTIGCAAVVVIIGELPGGPVGTVWSARSMQGCMAKRLVVPEGMPLTTLRRFALYCPPKSIHFTTCGLETPVRDMIVQTTPATWGEAMEVPEMRKNPLLLLWRGPVICTPGAEISTHGPQLEKDAHRNPLPL